MSSVFNNTRSSSSRSTGTLDRDVRGIGGVLRQVRLFFEDRPWFTPSVVPIDLFFFRRVFGRLYRQHGDSQGEVPIGVFQRSVVRLFRMMGMDEQAESFNAEEYDIDGSGAVGWYEFVTVWRKSEVSVRLSLPERVFVLMEDPSSCIIGILVSTTLTVLIAISCVFFMIATLPSMKYSECASCEPRQDGIFRIFEAACIGIFTLEYIVRVGTAPCSRSELLQYEALLEFVTDDGLPYVRGTCLRLLHFVIQPMNVIDLFVIVPFLIESVLDINASNFTVLRVLRLTRLFRIIKLGKSFEILQILGRVLHRSMHMFWVFAVNMLLALCFSAAAIYFAEGGTWDSDARAFIRVSHDGEKSVTPFVSIPHSFWWALVTFTTVGYGDEVPTTLLGKMIGACSMLGGIFVLALPISVISTTFGDVWQDWKEELLLEAQSREQDIKSVEVALSVTESRTHLTVELYDDQTGREQPEFLGGTSWTALPLDSKAVRVSGEPAQTLQPMAGKNMPEGADKSPLGALVASYVWTPSEFADDANFRGTLQVRVDRAEGLLKSNWKKHGSRDVYAVVRCWPVPPAGDGLDKDYSVQRRTPTRFATLSPVWNETFAFEFDWPRDWRPMRGDQRIAMAMVEAPQSPSAMSEKTSISKAPGTGATEGCGQSDALAQMVRRQGEDVRQLKEQVGEIFSMLRELRDEMRGRSVKDTDMSMTASSPPAGQPPEDALSSGTSAADSIQKELQASAKAELPGCVLD